jgi:signal transduction histidine kinase
MSGITLTRALRDDPTTAQLAVVILTAATDPETQREALAAGADDYLVKPIRRVELLLRVRSLLRIRALTKHLRRQTRRVEQQRDQLVDALQLRQQLFSMVVHDLKNPLAGMRGNLGLVLRSHGVSPDQRDALSDVDDAAEWMQRMVLQILDLTRPDGEGIEVDCVAVDAVALLEQVASPARRQLAELDRRLVVDLVAGGETVWADPGLLRRLVANLVDNAGRFAPRGTAVVLRAQPCSSGWRLDVEDEGPGVDLDKRSVIFEPYIRLEKSSRQTRGLGLAFCRLAAEAHGGCIGVEDRPGGGARFWIELPGPTT